MVRKLRPAQVMTIFGPRVMELALSALGAFVGSAGLAGLAGLVGFVGLAGCSAPPPPDSMAALESGDAAARTAWIIRTAADPDDGDIKLVVEALRSDDASERMLAITTLERLYGERLGYDFAGSMAEREAGAARWRARLFPPVEPSNTSP